MLFYTVECGLKALIMKAGKHRDSCGVAKIGHNLKKLSDSAKISLAEIGGEHVEQATIKSTGNSCGISDFHTAFRYEAILRPDSLQAVTDYLKALDHAIFKRLS